MAEIALRLTTLDRQHMQVALAALGFGSAGTDGALAPRTREMIAAWQKARNDPPTGYLTGAQNQALLREAAPAVSRFDEEQKKLDEARKKADEDKARAEAPTGQHRRHRKPPWRRQRRRRPTARPRPRRNPDPTAPGGERCSARRRAMAARCFSIC